MLKVITIMHNILYLKYNIYLSIYLSIYHLSIYLLVFNILGYLDIKWGVTKMADEKTEKIILYIKQFSLVFFVKYI